MNAMKTMFHARSGSRPEIQPVQVLRATESTVWTTGHGYHGTAEMRQARSTSYSGFFDTFDQAKAWLTTSIAREVELRRGHLRQFEDALAKAQAFQPPVDKPAA